MLLTPFVMLGLAFIVALILPSALHRLRHERTTPPAVATPSDH